MQDCFNETFFSEVFHQYYDRIFAGFYAKTRNEVVAQDLTQLTFIKFWEYRYSFSQELPVEVQLLRKAKLIFIDWLRKEAHQRKLMEEINKTSERIHQSPQFELTDTIRKALSQLPPMRRKVFQLAYLEGFSHKEIAAQLNISSKTVDNHVLKALKQLRKIISLTIVLAYISSDIVMK